MNMEKIKNLVLIGLVMLSIAFSIQLWLDVPIERIMANPNYFPGQDSEKDYDLSNFVLPRWIVVNFGGPSRTKLYRDSSTYRFYNDIYKEVSDVLLYVMNNNQNLAFSQVTREELNEAKLSKSVEVEYDDSFELQLMEKVFHPKAGQQSIPVSSIKNITLTVSTESALYMEDADKGVIHKVMLPGTYREINQLIDRLEERDPVKYWTWEEIGFSNNEFFYLPLEIYLPLEMSSFNLPVAVAVKELETEDQGKMGIFASSFFKDMSIVRKITEINGSLIYTDGQSALKVDTDGFVEYLVYSIGGNSKEQEQIGDVVDLALNYIDSHGGIPEQLYLDKIENITENGYKGYLLKFNYGYNGLPFFSNGKLTQSAIEVTVVNGRVVNYKRLVYRITKARVEQKPLLFPNAALDVIARRPGDLETDGRTVIVDMYLGYCIDIKGDKEYQAVPVWYIKSENKEFIIDAYQGSLMN
ncbi:MAG: hypothetical protein HPY66_2588 [Firmicutes bacterium]|nr:hypothetical protein [Bacillota bacterium]MDI6705024.1 two-component system activity regulator YycH [Bacillota bacterium]